MLFRHIPGNLTILISLGYPTQLALALAVILKSITIFICPSPGRVQLMPRRPRPASRFASRFRRGAEATSPSPPRWAERGRQRGGGDTGAVRVRAIRGHRGRGGAFPLPVRPANTPAARTSAANNRGGRCCIDSARAAPMQCAALPSPAQAGPGCPLKQCRGPPRAGRGCRWPRPRAAEGAVFIAVLDPAEALTRPHVLGAPRAARLDFRSGQLRFRSVSGRAPRSRISALSASPGALAGRAATLS